MLRKVHKGRGSRVVSTISIALVLVVVGALVFILLNARVVSDHVMRNIGVLVVIKDNTNEAEIKRAQKILDTRPFTYSTLYITKEQAAKSFKEEMGEDFEAILGANPLLPSIEIKLNPRYANNDSLATIEKGLLAMDIVHDVHYQKSLVQDINENMRRITLSFLIVGAVLMLISFTLIRNTIHLAVYSQRFLIKTMQLVGAKTGFIARPFLSGCMWRGFFGALVANVLLLAGVFFLQENYGHTLDFDFLQQETLLIMVLFVVICGILLSLFSAWFSVRRYLNKDLNDLYT
ncbi:MAG: permease-like cell division protein FtsX [Odoribacteraceae bacterium]|jgi:cell division transport system permease protein|nr:permease-like cell division protein FtsX [Odoribacteraceae bacterium]